MIEHLLNDTVKQNPFNVFIFGYKNMETLYINIQLWKLFGSALNKIYVVLPTNALEVMSAKQKDRYNDIVLLADKVLFITPKEKYKRVRGGGFLEALRLYYGKELDDNHNTVICFGGVWMLDPLKFISYYTKMLVAKKDMILYRTMLPIGVMSVGSEFFVVGKNVRKIFDSPMWSDNSETHEYLMTVLFPKYNPLFVNSRACKSETVSQYGYAAVLGKVHVHFFEQKVKMLKLHTEVYGSNIQFDLDALKFEDKGTTGEDKYHSIMPIDLEDNVSVWEHDLIPETEQKTALNKLKSYLATEHKETDLP